jgi:hypothetical protein
MLPVNLFQKIRGEKHVNKTKNKMARRKRTALRGPGALAFPEI